MDYEKAFKNLKQEIKNRSSWTFTNDEEMGARGEDIVLLGFIDVMEKDY